jgi:DNA modification methylase
MQVTHDLCRHYIGYDVSAEFMEFNRKVKDQITGKGDQAALFTNQHDITLREKSSTQLEEQDESVDLVFTSPPYWDIEYYGEEPEQLGYGKTYDDFLAGIQQVLDECHRVVKKDRYCVFNINDFRKGGHFYPYHADTIDLFSAAGFMIHDVVIVKWASAIGACFASQVEERKITAKSHEYLIVGKKG